jgi:hypothetical protein
MNRPQPNTTEDELYECQNCSEQWTESELLDIKDFDQRVAPGEPTPAGECPDCGCLCQPVGDDDEIEITVTAQQRATLVAALRFYQMNGQGDPDHRRDEIHELATADDAVISLDAAGIGKLFNLIRAS